MSFETLHSDLSHGCTRWYATVTERQTERVLDLDRELALLAVREFMPVDPALTE